jgi:hypothetical protein
VTAQQVPRRFAYHDAAAVGREIRNQRQFLFLAANFVPRNPKAVRVSHLGKAVVRGKLVASELVLPRRLGGLGAADGFVEGVDRQPAVCLDRLAGGVVEHEPPAQSTHHGFAGALERHLAPKRDDPGGLRCRCGRGGLRRFRGPGRIVAAEHIPARAAAKRRNNERGDD